MPNKIVTFQLHSVEYSGDNLGDDIVIDVTIDGATTTVKSQIKHGTGHIFSKTLSRFQSTAASVSKSVSATVTEVDTYSDSGTASGNVTVDVTGETGQSVGSVKVSVEGTAGDKNRTGEFTLNFIAVLEEVDRYVPDESRGWLKIRIEDGKEKVREESIPYTVWVKYSKTEGKREYFTIMEGTFSGMAASVSLDKAGNSRFSTKDERAGAVKLRLTKKTEESAVLEVIGTGLKYDMVSDPKNPIKNGIYDVEIPDVPHANPTYQAEGAVHATSWFRVDHKKARYIHVGLHSLGCASCKEVARWEELYEKLIHGRKDKASIGTMEVK